MSDFISTTMNSSQKAITEMQVAQANAQLNLDQEVSQSLDKDDFLKILITQLSHQDPTAPMEDKEFIAQMAQFSSLEQMTNMSQGFENMAGSIDSISNLLASSQAMGLLGKNVEILAGDHTVTGTVSEISGKEFPQVLVDNTYYDLSAVLKVKE